MARSRAGRPPQQVAARLQEAVRKAASQVQQLEADAARMRRELDNFERRRARAVADVAEASSERGAAEGAGERAKQRAATTAGELSKCRAEARRLQGACKQLELVQRAKDAKVRQILMPHRSICDASVGRIPPL